MTPMTLLLARRSALLLGLLWIPAVSATAQRASAPRDTVTVGAAIRAVFAAAEDADLTALDTLYAGERLTVVEGAGINRGWADYRDNHLGPELRAFRDFRYRPFEIGARIVGETAWATYRYALAARMGERAVDVSGRGTAILEWNGQRWLVRHTQTASRARRPADPPAPWTMGGR